MHYRKEEYNSLPKTYPTIQETMEGLPSYPVSHVDEGKHLLAQGVVSVPSGKVVHIAGYYVLKGARSMMEFLKEGEQAPFIKGESGVWMLQEAAATAGKTQKGSGMGSVRKPRRKVIQEDRAMYDAERRRWDDTVRDTFPASDPVTKY